MSVFDDIKTAINQAIEAEREKYSPDNPNLVEIVRCKNCKYFKPKESEFGDGKCALLFVAMKNNDYCSYGKEK